MRKTILSIMVFICVVSFAWNVMAEKEVELWDLVPGEHSYQILGPVGADGEEVKDAREQLRREAAKMDADAVMHVICKSGGIERQGLTWSVVRAYCRGIGIRLKGASKNSPLVAS